MSRTDLWSTRAVPLAKWVQTRFASRGFKVEDYIAYRVEFSQVGVSAEALLKDPSMRALIPAGMSEKDYAKAAMNRILYFFRKASDPAPRARCWGEWPLDRPGRAVAVAAPLELPLKQPAEVRPAYLEAAQALVRRCLAAFGQTLPDSEVDRVARKIVKIALEPVYRELNLI